MGVGGAVFNDLRMRIMRMTIVMMAVIMPRASLRRSRPVLSRVSSSGCRPGCRKRPRLPPAVAQPLSCQAQTHPWEHRCVGDSPGPGLLAWLRLETEKKYPHGNRTHDSPKFNPARYSLRQCGIKNIRFFFSYDGGSWVSKEHGGKLSSRKKSASTEVLWIEGPDCGS